MAVKSTCKVCGYTTEGEIKFCPICGGETAVNDDARNTAYQQQATGYPGYTPNPNTYMQPVQQPAGKGGCAIAGMIVGIVSLVFSCSGIIGLIAGVVGLILSIAGLKSDKRGMAVAGVICSSIALALAFITFIACSGSACSAFTDGFKRGFEHGFYGY